MTDRPLGKTRAEESEDDDTDTLFHTLRRRSPRTPAPPPPSVATSDLRAGGRTTTMAALASARAPCVASSRARRPTRDDVSLSADRRRVGTSGRRDALVSALTLLATAGASDLPAPRRAWADVGGGGGGGGVYMPFEELESRARTAYREKRLEDALDYLTRIIALEPDDGQWYERRAQVLVDLKRFELALADFDAAVERYEPEYKSLGLLSNRALAHEGLYEWEAAAKDYSEAIRLSRSIGSAPPYVLNSRGNAYASLARWEDALADYDEAASVFQKSRNLSGAIYAQSNAALVLAEARSIHWFTYDRVGVVNAVS